MVSVLIYAATRKPEPSLVARYTEDTIYGIRWRWSYGQHGLYGLHSFCPQCDMQVDPRPASAYQALDFVEYHCDDCGAHLHRFEFGQDEVESRVKRKIQQALRKEIRQTNTQAA